MSRTTRLFPALRHRNFRLFYVGFVVSLLGSWMQRVALSWLVLDLTDSAFYVGLVDAVSMLPVLFFTLWAGVVADRFPRRAIVLTTQTGAMVFSAILAALVFAQVITVWQVVVLATAIGLTNAFDIPARHALMIDLVGKEDLTNAIALNSSAFNATRVVGPAIAGAVIGIIGVAICFLLNSVSFLAVIAALLLLRLPMFQPRVGLRSPWKDLGEGFRYITSDVRSRTLVLNIAAFSVFGVPVFVLMPVMTRDVLGLGADAYGWMMSAVGVGALTGALGLAVFGHRLPRGRGSHRSGESFGRYDRRRHHQTKTSPNQWGFRGNQVRQDASKGLHGSHEQPPDRPGALSSSLLLHGASGHDQLGRRIRGTRPASSGSYRSHQ